MAEERHGELAQRLTCCGAPLEPCLLAAARPQQQQQGTARWFVDQHNPQQLAPCQPTGQPAAACPLPCPSLPLHWGSGSSHPLTVDSLAADLPAVSQMLAAPQRLAPALAARSQHAMSPALHQA